MAIPGDVRALTDPYLGTFTPVPPAADGICDVCHSAPNPGWPRCLSCERTIGQVSRPLTRVVPITLCARMGPVHYLLRQYKDGPAQLRRRLMPRVAALLARFLQQHRRCIGGWDLITVVPSSIGRPGSHPLAQAINMVPALADTYRALLQAGLHSAGHLAAGDDAFVVTGEATPGRVLLVDDTFTTGAEVQSAASALQAAGATISAAVVIGRYINPDFSQATQNLWEQAQSRPFRFERCCLCEEPWQ
jgi:predicted amidophosphoribosyltransferase